MANLKGRDLKKIGYPQARVIGIALNLMNRSFKSWKKKEALELLSKILAAPEDFLEGEFSEIATALLPDDPQSTEGGNFDLEKETRSFPIYGESGIEAGALQQMYTAMKLPVTRKGALMPDAHQGYGLPIGGVLATENAVIPYGVGVDIGCRMCLSIFDLPPQLLAEQNNRFKDLLLENTRFGLDEFEQPLDDPIFERPEFKEIKLLKTLKQKAYSQIGTSGSGNHFVEFGVAEITNPDPAWSLPPGNYLALLSHSGSRGLGAQIARHYTQIAMQKCVLPKHARHLAWLSLDSADGQEYWNAMTLAGDYASANHHHIHQRIATALKCDPLAMVENHHNFAWKETFSDGNQLIVHRKGATPAGEGMLGIIPGSMSSPGFIIKGKGNPQSLNSASHGAGRSMSRSQAKQVITKKMLSSHLKDLGIVLIGGGLDEAPMAYKNIDQVMAHQQDLVEILGKFHPKIVRMAT